VSDFEIVSKDRDERAAESADVAAAARKLTDAAQLLARPVTIGGRVMRNRIVQSPMSVSYADGEGFVTAKMTAHYARRAAGGAGMVITENLAVSVTGRQLPRQALVCDERHLPGLTDLAAAIQHEGALAVCQIVHAGRYAGPWEQYERARRLAPSPVPFELTPGRIVTPDEITAEEISRTLQEFAFATELVRRAGFDGVEIHGAQGMLVSSFQSPLMNVRKDGYGRDRNRFAREVVDAVTTAAGDMLVGYHLFTDELMEGGHTSADAVEFAREIEDAGVDFLIPTPATFESLRSSRAVRPDIDPIAHQPQTAAHLAAAVSTPIFANGGLGSADAAQRALATGDVQAVALARALFIDPDWPRLTLAGQPTRRCSCAPPVCLQTQLTGSLCPSWPAEIQEQGYWGMQDLAERDRAVAD
jgi:2,4-dienoyl-CoA reductase (NADPH2)